MLLVPCTATVPRVNGALLLSSSRLHWGSNHQLTGMKPLEAPPPAAPSSRIIPTPALPVPPFSPSSMRSFRFVFEPSPLLALPFPAGPTVRYPEVSVLRVSSLAPGPSVLPPGLDPDVPASLCWRERALPSL